MVDIYTEDPHHKNTVPARVYANQPAGSETLVTLTVGDTEFLAIQVGLVEYDMNQNVFVVLHPGRMNVYNKETGRLIKYAKTKHKAGTDD
jgi:multiple sugar transport system ATP-binding protein